ncbi:MAG: SUMF1/EgtB/PvdO family nonheme iron enzyme [Myxococcota bacterium]
MRYVLAFALLLGCEATSASPDARLDGARLDGARLDGGAPGVDASAADGGSDAGSFDGGARVPDGGPADVGTDAMDEGTPCTVGGVSGTCEPVSTCDGISTPGFCPGPAEIQCCTTPSAGACDPAAMPTPNAGLLEETGDPGCPAGMVDLGAFCMDRFEASLVVVDDSGAAVGSWSPFHNPGTRRVAAVSLRNAIPQGYINGRQAADACAVAGKRLCTNTEWLAACQGSAGRTYPYGTSRRAGICNDARATHPAVERFGTSADWIWSELDDACINQIPDSLARTGSHPECVTPEGVLDLMGNLHEWTSDASGVFRGGFYADTRINGEGCLYRTTAHSTGHFDYSTGFRCCASRE